MTTLPKSTTPVRPVLLRDSMLWGALIALVLISFFLFSAGKGNPAWSKYWMVKPIIIVPFGGAVGGACFAWINGFRNALGWNRTICLILSLVIYLIGLWLSFVLGLNGTYWN